MACVEFVPNPARKPEGLGEGGVEQFRGKPYVSCARECGQNSNDAGIKESDERDEPVVMRFDLHEIERSDLPFAEKLLDVCRICLADSEDKAKRMGNDPDKDRTVQFFRRAVEEMSRPSIRVLEVADFNTTGLTGPMDDPESVFNSLVKADGVNNKRSDDSGGAFGIGKKAAFAVSHAQTVLYSTLTEDDEGNELHSIQARMQLLSHEIEGEPYRAEGYWGEAGFGPITDMATVPDWMVRQERGTSLFVICFPDQDDWAERMEISILTNFATAIQRDKMAFKIDDGRITINSSTLAERLGSERMDEIADRAGLKDQLAYARNLLTCLSSGATLTFTLDVPGYGKADLHILVQPELPRRILIVRNGMYIVDHLRAFNQALAHFAQTMEFLAILEPSGGDPGKDFGALLKRLENPEHNAFEPSRIITDEEQEKVRKAINALVSQIRKKINEVAKVESSDSDEIEELAHLFASDPDDEGDSDQGEDDPERYDYGRATSTRRKPKTPSTPDAGSEGGNRHSGTGKRGEKGGGHGKGKGDGAGGKGTSGRRNPVDLTDARVFQLSGSEDHGRKLLFTPQAGGKILVDIAASGLTSASDLSVSACNAGRVVDGNIEIEVEAGERTEIRFDLTEDYHGPVEVTAVSAEDAGDSA